MDAARKTYKREVALVLLGVYLVLLFGTFWYPQAIEAAESIKIPAFTFAAAAFGFDAWAKQVQR